MDYKQSYVPRMDIYFSERYVKKLFGELLSSPPSRSNVCDTVMKGPRNITGLVVSDNCTGELATLPGTENVPPFRLDGYHQGCWSLHSAFAAVNPKGHCPHLSFTAMKDPNGHIKCQTSLNMTRTDFFTAGELEEWNQFVVRHGADPALGYIEYSNTTRQ
jgi:hypothetical protein